MQLLYVEDHDGASVVSLNGVMIYADEPESGFDNAYYSAIEVAECLYGSLHKDYGDKLKYRKVFLSKADAKGKALMFDDMIRIGKEKVDSFSVMICDGCIAGKAEFIVPGMIRLCQKCFEKDLK